MKIQILRYTEKEFSLQKSKQLKKTSIFMNLDLFLKDNLTVKYIHSFAYNCFYEMVS